MHVIYFLFALEKFQCLFELTSGLSTCVTFIYASFCIIIKQLSNPTFVTLQKSWVSRSEVTKT